MINNYHYCSVMQPDSDTIVVRLYYYQLVVIPALGLEHLIRSV
jgi:hypothetical protein